MKVLIVKEVIACDVSPVAMFVNYILQCQLKIVRKYQHACRSGIGCNLRDGGGDDAEEEEDQGRRQGGEV